jgi:hypothetical protein
MGDYQASTAILAREPMIDDCSQIKLVFWVRLAGLGWEVEASRHGFESHTQYDVGFYTFIFPRSRGKAVS